MALALQALPPGYRAVVLGASGALGAALLDLLRADPGCALALGLHPGTVTSALSAPFRGAEIGRPAATAAAELLAVIDRLTREDSGGFFSYRGEPLPW